MPTHLHPSNRDGQTDDHARRYEHDAPGGLLHIGTKKLGRIVRPSHRVTGNQRDSVDDAGWETLFVAIDDHARIAFTAMRPDENKHEAVAFLQSAVGYYAGLGLGITDTDGQRRSVSIKGIRCSLQSSGDSAQVRQAVPPANQWQGRAVHPVGTTRVGLWLEVSELSAANPSPGELAAPLQPAPTAQRHRSDCPDGQAHPRK